MSRTSSFSRSDAIDAALRLFWRKGYLATSLPELLEAMGIARSSFYSTFADKRALFKECLELFGDRTRRILTDSKEHGTELAAISQFFDKTVTAVSNDRLACGCMMVNTLLELEGVDSQLHAIAKQKLDEIQFEFERLLDAAQKDGSIGKQHSAAELANMVMTLNLGLRVQCRKHLDRPFLENTLRNGLDVLQIAA